MKRKRKREKRREDFTQEEPFELNRAYLDVINAKMDNLQQRWIIVVLPVNLRQQKGENKISQKIYNNKKK